MVVAGMRGLLLPMEKPDNMKLVRENTILLQVQRDIESRSHELMFLREAAAAQYVSTDKGLTELFNFHWKASDNFMYEFLGATQPWHDWHKVAERIKQEDYERSVRQWEQQYGDLNDPETQAKIDRTYKYLIGELDE